MVKAIQEKYPNKVRVIFKHFPLSFHKAAPAAHAASIAFPPDSNNCTATFAASGVDVAHIPFVEKTAPSPTDG